MRDKSEKKELSGVADGIDFTSDIKDIEEATDENDDSVKETKKVKIDSNRSYSPYYTPKPKKGSKGGTLGRGAVEESNRKIQFSLTCTLTQKERFAEAAKKDKRKLPDFICMAVEEYIENHNL